MAKKMLLILVALLFGVCGMLPQASAVPLAMGVDNQLFFNNFESVFAGDQQAGYNAGDYISSAPAVPSLFDRDPGPDGVYGTGDDLKGDHFMGIINIQNIDAAGSPIWMAGGGIAPPNQLTGVFAQEIWAIHVPDPYDPANILPHLVLGAPSITAFTDPFGNAVDISAHLSGNEIIALYEESGLSTTYFESNGTMNDDVIKATSGGSLWGTLGYGPGVDGQYGTVDDPGFFYSHVSLGVPLVNFTGETWAQLDFIQDNTGVPTWIGINDPNEGEMDAFLGFLLNDLYMSGELEPNPNSHNFAGGNSPWDVASNDPAHLHPVPEPATMLLLGGGLVGLAGFARKRAKKLS